MKDKCNISIFALFIGYKYQILQNIKYNFVRCLPGSLILLFPVECNIKT